MFYIRFIRDGKRKIRWLFGWDALCNAISALESQGIDASNWGECY